MWGFLLFLGFALFLVLHWGQTLERLREGRNRDLSKRLDAPLTHGEPVTDVTVPPPPVVSPVPVSVEGKSVSEWLDEQEAGLPAPGERLTRVPGATAARTEGAERWDSSSS